MKQCRQTTIVGITDGKKRNKNLQSFDDVINTAESIEIMCNAIELPAEVTLFQ